MLFDLDGTLVDTAEANYLAYSDALGEVGVAVPRAVFDTVAFGRNWRQFLPELLRDGGSTADAAAVAGRKRALYPNRCPAIRFNAPLWDLVLAVRRELKTALVTTASAESVAAVLTGIDMAAHFDAVVTGDDVARHKPAPDAYFLATDRLGVDPPSCLAFEDSDIGIASAQAAGIGVMRLCFKTITES